MALASRKLVPVAVLTTRRSVKTKLSGTRFVHFSVYSALAGSRGRSTAAITSASKAIGSESVPGERVMRVAPRPGANGLWDVAQSCLIEAGQLPSETEPARQRPTRRRSTGFMHCDVAQDAAAADDRFQGRLKAPHALPTRAMAPTPRPYRP